MSQKFFQIIRPVHVHLKTDKVDLKKRPPWKKNFLQFFSIDSSSRHEKRCQMLQRLFWLFQCFRNTQCIHIELLIILASHQIISYAFTHWYILVSHCKTPYPRWYGTASLTFFYYKTTLSSHPKCWYPSCYCYFTVKTS